MAKIDRFSGNVAPFASQADTNDRTTFGTTTTGVDTLDGNVTTEFLEGWAIVGPNEFPSLQDFNAVGFTLSQYIAYLHQMGVAEWDGAQQYQIGSIVNRNGVLYVCRTANHVSATAPESDSINWRNETQIQAALAYAVSQLSSGDKTKVGLLINGTVVDALDYVVYPPELTIWATNGATGISDGTLNTGTGSAGGVTGTLSRVDTATADKAQWLGTPIGSTVALASHITGVIEPPKDSDLFRYVKLTAGESGVGQYNEGALTAESVSGTAPLVVATAQISDASSPLNGQTISLLNTEGAFIRPGETSGVAQFDQMQGHWHEVRYGNTDGAFQSIDSADNTIGTDATGSAGAAVADGANGTPRTGPETRPRNESRVYYMRIR